MHVDMILQGKGGVGKSLIASLLAQHYGKAGRPIRCVDTDPVNATFAGYRAFGATRLDLMQGDDIDPRAFDRLIEMIVDPGLPPETIMVVDNGASTFVPLCSYLVSNEVIPFVRDRNHTIRLHTVLTGGQALDDTFQGFAALCNAFSATPIVVWRNEYFGPLARDGYDLANSAVWKSYEHRVCATVTLPAVKQETFGRDLEQMLSARQTFAEADADQNYSSMARQRLRMMWRRFELQLEALRQ